MVRRGIEFIAASAIRAAYKCKKIAHRVHIANLALTMNKQCATACVISRLEIQRLTNHAVTFMRQMKRVGFGILMMLAIAVTGHSQTLCTISGVVKDKIGRAHV